MDCVSIRGYVVICNPVQNVRLVFGMLYSPAAIIRNAKIWNIILLVAFFRT